MTDPQILRKVKVKYKKSSDYRAVFADSALIGEAMGRAITLDFYVGNYVPVDELHVVKTDGKVDVTTDVVEAQPYERTIQIQVVMTPENAQDLVDAVNQRIKAMNKEKEDDKK